MPEIVFTCSGCHLTYPVESEALACEARGVRDLLPVGLMYQRGPGGVYEVVSKAWRKPDPHDGAYCYAWNASGGGDFVFGDGDCTKGPDDLSLIQVPVPGHVGFDECLAWAKRVGITPILFTEAMRPMLCANRTPAPRPPTPEVVDAVRLLETSNAYLQRDLDAAREETRQVKDLLEQERKRNKDKSSVAGKLISYYRAGLLEAKRLLIMDPDQGSIQVVGVAKIQAFLKAYGADPAKEQQVN